MPTLTKTSFKPKIYKIGPLINPKPLSDVDIGETLSMHVRCLQFNLLINMWIPRPCADHLVLADLNFQISPSFPSTSTNSELNTPSP